MTNSCWSWFIHADPCQDRTLFRVSSTPFLPPVPACGPLKSLKVFVLFPLSFRLGSRDALIWGRWAPSQVSFLSSWVMMVCWCVESQFSMAFWFLCLSFERDVTAGVLDSLFKDVRTFLKDRAGGSPWSKGQACLRSSVIMSPSGTTCYKRFGFRELRVPLLLTQPTVWAGVILWVLGLEEMAQMPIPWLPWLLWIIDVPSWTQESVCLDSTHETVTY